MSTYTKIPLSSQVSGKPIQMGSSPTGIHTCQAATGTYDEVLITACNNDSVSHKLTLNVGGSSSDKQIVTTLNAYEGLVIIIPGLPLNNSVQIDGFGDVAGMINVMGHVLRQS